MVLVVWWDTVGFLRNLQESIRSLQMIPLLSICIPTYNHAELLKILLHSLVPQVNELNGKVELAISDNCSTDHTAEVVNSFCACKYIQYRCNSYNIGGSRNVIFTPRDLATGEYCWVIGDDDMIIQGQLHKIVSTILNNPIIDAFYTNIALELVSERNKIIMNNNSEFTPNPSKCMVVDWEDQVCPCWEDLLGMMNNKADMLTAVVAHIIRRSVWCKYIGVLGYEGMRGEQDFSNLALTYPHTKMIATAMVGKQAYFIGHPSVLMGQSYDVHYVDSVPVIDLFRRNDLFDYFTKLGISNDLLGPYREHWLRRFGPNIMKGRL